MGKEYATVFREAEGFYEEKKSKFIASVFHVTSEAEVQEKMEAVRKKYYDARHHCFAYVLGADKDKVKQSDDGEPQKTAGIPILNVINGENATDTLIVVTRYFGGTLLGTGGLVRAYTKAAQDGLKNACVFTKNPAMLLRIDLRYEDHNRLSRYFAEQELQPVSVDFSDIVSVKIPVRLSELEDFRNHITECTQNKGIINEEGEVYFALIDGKTVLFES